MEVTAVGDNPNFGVFPKSSDSLDADPDESEKTQSVESGLPEHEDDSTRQGDTDTQTLNG